MRKHFVFIVCLIFLISLPLAHASSEYYSYSYARLSYVQGDVFIQHTEDLGFEEGVVNLTLIEGEKLGTREGRTEIHFGRKNYLRLDSHTKLDLIKLPRQGDDLIKLHLLSGNVYLRIDLLEREKDIEIHTPDASFYFLEEGLYRLEVREDRECEIFVLEGSAEAAGEEGSVLVREDEKLVASNGSFLSEAEYFSSRYLEDGFAEWNISRDSLHKRYVERNYLPSELNEYEAELANNGRWIYEAPYGNVWIPRVSHSTWRPYYHGRWVWYPIIGWNWVSYDPWGWCVHHYGRWHWGLGLGWYWIPTRHWGPSWVHWHHGYDYIGWSPLSYYNHPVVIVNNRFYGRYNNRSYPVHSRALTVVHKNQLQNRQISKVALSGNQTSRLGKISLSSKQPSIRPAVNKNSIQSKEAAKVLSRSNVRPVGKAFSSGTASRSISRVGADAIRGSSGSIIDSKTIGKNRSVTTETGKLLHSTTSSRSFAKHYSSSSARAPSSSRSSSTPVTNLYSRSQIKIYPSKQISSSGSKTTRPSSSYRNIRSYSDSKSSSGASSRTGIRDYQSRSPNGSSQFSREYPSSVSETYSQSRSRLPERSSVTSYSSRNLESPSYSRSNRTYTRSESPPISSSYRSNTSARYGSSSRKPTTSSQRYSSSQGRSSFNSTSSRSAPSLSSRSYKPSSSRTSSNSYSRSSPSSSRSSSSLGSRSSSSRSSSSSSRSSSRSSVSRSSSSRSSSSKKIKRK